MKTEKHIFEIAKSYIDQAENELAKQINAKSSPCINSKLNILWKWRLPITRLPVTGQASTVTHHAFSRPSPIRQSRDPTSLHNHLLHPPFSLRFTTTNSPHPPSLLPSLNPLTAHAST
ncbi:unnamed protein product, partial [Sphenostylis stenocarpa]